jgi:hypothetical protein
MHVEKEASCDYTHQVVDLAPRFGGGIPSQPSPSLPLAPIPANNFTVVVESIPTAGAAWIVRVYRKGFLRKKPVSSDWFLDREQAETFAADLRNALGNMDSLEYLKTRPPGWTLFRPSR